MDVARRYHAKLATHYGRLARFANVATLIGGTAVVTQLVEGVPSAELAMGLLVMGASILSLVFDWTGKATKHRNLYVRYGQLAGRLIRDGYSAVLRAEELDIETEEDGVLNVLFLISWNEQANASQLDDRRYRINWLQRRMAYFLDVGPAIWELEPE